MYSGAGKPQSGVAGVFPTKNQLVPLGSRWFPLIPGHLRLGWSIPIGFIQLLQSTSRPNEKHLKVMNRFTNETLQLFRLLNIYFIHLYVITELSNHFRRNSNRIMALHYFFFWKSI